MRLSQVLYSQGFGTRRDCLGLIQRGCVRIGGQAATDPQCEFATEGLVFEVDGVAWPFHVPALLLLHKPAGYECSRKPRHHPSVLSLLPPPLRRREVQPVGRLDEDTTGVLLLTDDGALLHRLTSPKQHVPKVYEVTTRHALDDGQRRRLLDGVVLDDAPQPVRADACEILDDHSLRLTISQGKYHQVKRMIAAVGNRVEALHRSRFGALGLGADLAPGCWRWLAAGELAAGGLTAAPA